MQKFADIIKTKTLARDHRNSYEFQAYGNRLADDLNDPRHRALYIKLAKTEDRVLLANARDHVMAAEKIHNKGRLFMWKLKELKKARKAALDNS